MKIREFLSQDTGLTNGGKIAVMCSLVYLSAVGIKTMINNHKLLHTTFDLREKNTMLEMEKEHLENMVKQYREELNINKE